MTAPTEQHRERARKLLDSLAWETLQSEERGDSLPKTAAKRREHVAAAFAELEAEVRAEQREADARIADEHHTKHYAETGSPQSTSGLEPAVYDGAWRASEGIAAAIRATAAPEQEPKP